MDGNADFWKCLIVAVVVFVVVWLIYSVSKEDDQIGF